MEMIRNDMRQLVIDRLMKQGWITRAWLKEVDPKQTAIMVDWTEQGLTKMQTLCALYDELGFIKDFRRGGELEALYDFIRISRGAKAKDAEDGSTNQ
jgi:hypothetical protein